MNQDLNNQDNWEHLPEWVKVIREDIMKELEKRGML